MQTLVETPRPGRIGAAGLAARERSASAPVNLSRSLGRIRLLGADWVRVELGRGAGFALPAGDHSTAHFVTRGSIDIQVGQAAPIRLEAGGSAILPYGWAHSLRQDGGGVCEQIRYFEEVHETDIPPTLRIMGPGAGLSALVLTAQLHLDWPAELPRPKSLPQVLLGTRSYRTDRTAAESAARALENTASRPGGSLCLTRFAELLLAREMRDVLISQPQLIDLRDEASTAVVRALDAVRMKPGHAWSVERLGRHVGMSRSTFAAAFKAVYDMGPMEMVAAKRMEAAARLICDSGLRVKEIAAKVGYQSDTAFLRRFTAHFGASPTVYKQRRADSEDAESEDWLNLVG